MRVYELDQSGGALARLLAERIAQEQTRTGIHVGTVIHDMLKRMEPAKYNRQTKTDTLHAMWETGNVVEDLIAEQLARRVGWQKPRPRTVDGLTGSPDGWSHATRTIDEVKATWTSRANLPTSLKWTAYMLQGLSYCYMFDAVRLRLHVTYLSFPQPPSTFVIRFTRREAREKFEQVRQHAVDIGWLTAA